MKKLFKETSGLCYTFILMQSPISEHEQVDGQQCREMTPFLSDKNQNQDVWPSASISFIRKESVKLVLIVDTVFLFQVRDEFDN